MSGHNHGGVRRGAGRPKGSKNKTTIAREAVAEILDIEDAAMMTAEVHRRGHELLAEMERIASDPTQPVAARIMAARVALPFLVPKQIASPGASASSFDLIETLQSRRNQLAQMN